MLRFHPDNHKYESVDLINPIDWVSASKLPSFFKKEFDERGSAEKAARNKKSKWYGMGPEEIIGLWKKENLRSTSLGTWYHERAEKATLSQLTADRLGKPFSVFPSLWEDGYKIAPNQKLATGLYPEHLAYSLAYGVCGQFDEIIVDDGWVDVDDFKSNKYLKKQAFVNWEGRVERMLSPLAHLELTKLNEYALQLSLGMWMVLRHNPHLKARDCTIIHITFELEGEDKFGYPILRMENGEPIIKDTERIKIPYMKREVEIMVEWLKERRLVNV